MAYRYQLKFAVARPGPQRAFKLRRIFFRHRGPPELIRPFNPRKPKGEVHPEAGLDGLRQIWKTMRDRERRRRADVPKSLIQREYIRARRCCAANGWNRGAQLPMNTTRRNVSHITDEGSCVNAASSRRANREISAVVLR